MRKKSLNLVKNFTLACQEQEDGIF